MKNVSQIKKYWYADQNCPNQFLLIFMNQWLETIFFVQNLMNSRRQVMGNINWSQDDLPFPFKHDSIKSLSSNERLSKD